MEDQDSVARARAILDSSDYMILGTADGDGNPWVSPVFFAAAEYRDFYWVSSPEVTHSRNLARRPQLGIVVFDSQQPPGTGLGVYMSAVASELSDEADLSRGLEVYPGRAGSGIRQFTVDDMRAPSPYRLYRATVSEHSMLCPRVPGHPCESHGRQFDHRTPVAVSNGP